MSTQIRDKIRGALIGAFIGDALAMPVHWYYNVDQLKRDFGEIKTYEAPKERFPGSIMNLSNTGGGGRGSDEGDIVGTVILHGKKKYWVRGGNYHYHHGMTAGENTLDAHIIRVLIQSMSSSKRFDRTHYLQEYITFMTTPNSHNDIYAGTCHRMFFKNLVNGKSPQDCADNDGHNVDAIDALMLVPPLAIAAMDSTSEVRENLIREAIQSIRKTDIVLPFANAFSEMLISVVKGERTIRDAAVVAGQRIGFNVATAARRYASSDPMTACYIDSAFPVMLIFAYKYGDNVEQMLLASTNAGGENVARGSLLGSLAGAQVGYEQLPAHLRDGLVLKSNLNADIDAFIETFCNISLDHN